MFIELFDSLLCRRCTTLTTSDPPPPGIRGVIVIKFLKNAITYLKSDFSLPLLSWLLKYTVYFVFILSFLIEFSP